MTRLAFAAFCLSVLISLPAMAYEMPDNNPLSAEERQVRKDFRQAALLFDRGMYDMARAGFEAIANATGDYMAEGYAVFCSVHLQSEGYETALAQYQKKHPYSGLIPQMRYQYGLNLFDRDEYQAALEEFDAVSRHRLYRSQETEFLFKKAYCDFSLGNYERALQRFSSLEKRTYSDYTSPARYAMGYIYYRQKNFTEAIGWFEKAAKDSRFTAMSDYYIIESNFMLENYKTVCEEAPALVEKVPQERRSHVIRLISESWLVLGDADKARYWFDMNKESSEIKSRSDYFYAGSVLYAVDDYQGAIDNYSMMTDRTDSLGQLANYHLGYSYIQTRNKVAAMEAFKGAAEVGYNPDISEDAYFNYAKLAFDLNNDTSVFNDYLKKYSDVDKGERINAYIAVAALYGHDYETAIDAYGKIDNLDGKMKSNYMKANYLRAEQLISDGSYRDAIPYLKAAAWYSDKRTMFNQMARFWIAESHYRNDQFEEALSLYGELYNISALYGMKEGYLIPYNIAYCYFKQGDYVSSAKWFNDYLLGGSAIYRKEALVRYADCRYMLSDYAGAAAAYSKVMKDYYDVNDIYPYYQAAMSYGLEGSMDKKISLLENVGKASPSSQFYPEALFELGRSYVLTEENDKAAGCFDRLIGTVRDSTYIARAMIELGMICRNSSEVDKALGYYKNVVENFPLSGYADDALMAVESIYQSLNKPEEYLSYIDRIGKSDIKSEDEKEMMIFNAAEQIYLSENYQKALVSLQSYKDKYPMGHKNIQADFYMAECYRNLGQREKACDYYAKVVENGEGSFREISMLNFATVSYELQRYEDALGGYSALFSSALLENNKYSALLGMMRSAYRARHYEEALTFASDVRKDGRTVEDVIKEADYIRAKSYLATSRRSEAFAILDSLSTDLYCPEGAEAAWLIIQDCYDRGEFDEVESKVYSFSDAGSGQTYWLAKSFIVLGDAFVEKGELEQAKATFESIAGGYKPQSGGDDVLDNVKIRLSKIEEMMKNTADEYVQQ